MSEFELPRKKVVAEQRRIYARTHGAAAIAFALIRDNAISLKNEVVDLAKGYDDDAVKSIHRYGEFIGLGPNGFALTEHYREEIAASQKELFEESLRSTGE